jgi:hypothetical protein
MEHIVEEAKRKTNGTRPRVYRGKRLNPDAAPFIFTLPPPSLRHSKDRTVL